MSNNIKALLIKIINLTFRYMRGFFVSVVVACAIFSAHQGTFNAELDLHEIYIFSIFIYTVLFIVAEILKARESLQNTMLIITNAVLTASILYYAEEFFISCIIYMPQLILFFAAFFVVTTACIKHVLIERKDILVKDQLLATIYGTCTEPFDVYVEDLKHG